MDRSMLADGSGSWKRFIAKPPYSCGERYSRAESVSGVFVEGLPVVAEAGLPAVGVGGAVGVPARHFGVGEDEEVAGGEGLGDGVGHFGGFDGGGVEEGAGGAGGLVEHVRADALGAEGLDGDAPVGVGDGEPLGEG